VLNKYVAHYINTAKQHDSNTLVRFGDVVMHRIYNYGNDWYLADYTTMGADISLMRRSDHPLGPRFDYANLDEQRAIFKLTIQPFTGKGLSAEENFLRHVRYYVVGKNGFVYRFNPATNALEDSVKAEKAWQYNYTVYDSIFYCCPRIVDSIYTIQPLAN
jgi:hypothetical protein